MLALEAADRFRPGFMDGGAVSGLPLAAASKAGAIPASLSRKLTVQAWACWRAAAKAQADVA